MDLGLKGKRAIVTGASRGIGRATVELLAAEGVSVAFCARGAEEVAAFEAELKASGVQALGAVVDVSNQEELTAFINRAAAEFGGLDIFVSNVSAGSVKGPDQWVTSLNVDLMPLVWGTEAVVPHLEAAGGGQIVAISSTFGFDTVWPSSPNSYGAFKAAVIQYASAQAHALAPKGIRVNSVSPGPIEFEGGAWGNMKIQRPEIYDKVKSSIPLGRMGELKDVASAIVFLASGVAGFTVGTNIMCDGGMTSRVQF